MDMLCPICKEQHGNEYPIRMQRSNVDIRIDNVCADCMDEWDQLQIPASISNRYSNLMEKNAPYDENEISFLGWMLSEAREAQDKYLSRVFN